MILEWLERAATDRPDHPFIVEPGAAMTFGQLALAVQQRHENRRGAATPGRVVGLAMAPTAETLVAILELWMAGAVVQPVPPGGLAGTDSGLAEMGDALIMATSGSTGGPKLVRLTFENLAASAAASAEHLDHWPDDRWLCNLALHHIAGLSIVLRSLREASTVILEPGFDARRTAALLSRGDATLASLVPTTLQRTLDAANGSGWGCRAVLVGGGPLRRSLLDEALETGLQVLPTYGMTETASQIATAIEPGGPLVALPGVELRIGDDAAIEVKGPMVSPGYLGEPPRAIDWFTTGDSGHIEDGRLIVKGRLDNVIITGGENVNPEVVEAVLESLPGIDAACVVGLPDPEWGARVVAVYEGTDALPAELRSAAATRLARYEVPSRWIRVDQLPRSGIGKIDRLAVQALAKAG